MTLPRRRLLQVAGVAAAVALIPAAPAHAKPRRTRQALAGFGVGPFGTAPFGQ